MPRREVPFGQGKFLKNGAKPAVSGDGRRKVSAGKDKITKILCVIIVVGADSPLAEAELCLGTFEAFRLGQRQLDN